MSYCSLVMLQFIAGHLLCQQNNVSLVFPWQPLEYRAHSNLTTDFCVEPRTCSKSEIKGPGQRRPRQPSVLSEGSHKRPQDYKEVLQQLSGASDVTTQHYPPI